MEEFRHVKEPTAAARFSMFEGREDLVSFSAQKLCVRTNDVPREHSCAIPSETDPCHVMRDVQFRHFSLLYTSR